MRELDDDAAYMLLLTSNAQGELSPLERGMHALGATQKGKHTQSVNAYAQAIGVPSRTVSNWVQAAEVYHKVCPQGQTLNLIERTKHLIEIHAAPQWLWQGLVAVPLAKGWTVELTKSAVRRVKDAVEPPAYLDIAAAIVSGRMSGWSRARRSQGPSGCRTDTHAAPRAATSCIRAAAAAIIGLSPHRVARRA